MFSETNHPNNNEASELNHANKISLRDEPPKHNQASETNQPTQQSGERDEPPKHNQAGNTNRLTTSCQKLSKAGNAQSWFGDRGGMGFRGGMGNPQGPKMTHEFQYAGAEG